MAMEPSAGFCYFVDVELPIKKLYVMCAMELQRMFLYDTYLLT